MKKLLLSCTAVVALMTGVAVAAEQDVDGAALYKARCAGCHAIDGTRSVGEGIKALKGQSEEESYKKMLGYIDGTYGGAKKMGMVAVMKSLKAEEIKALAKHIGSL